MTDNSHEAITDLLGVLTSLKVEFFQYAPKIILSIGILIGGILTAYFLKWFSFLVVRSCLKLLPNSISERPIIKDNFQPLALGTGRILFFITIFLAIAASLKKLELLVVSDWLQNLSQYLPNIVGAFFILFVGWKSREILTDLVNRSLDRADFQYARIISQVFGWSCFLVALLVALEQIGMDMTLVIAVSTTVLGVITAGIALTFALGAKATISDILYCYQLRKYFKTGHKIAIKGIEGTIVSIGPIFILVKSNDGNITVPGSLFNREMAKVYGTEENSRAGG